MDTNDVIKHDPEALGGHMVSSAFATSHLSHYPMPLHPHDSSDHTLPALPKYTSSAHHFPQPSTHMSTPPAHRYSDFTQRPPYISDPMLGIQTGSPPSPLQASSLHPEATHPQVYESPDLFRQTLSNLREALPPQFPRPLSQPQLDLHLLYRIVTNSGGRDTVTNKGLWPEVAAQLRHACPQAVRAPPDPTHLHSIYMHHLFAYEQVYYHRNPNPQPHALTRPPFAAPASAPYPNPSMPPLSLPAPLPSPLGSPTASKPPWQDGSAGTVSSSMTVNPSDLTAFTPPAAPHHPQVVVFAPPQSTPPPTASLVGAPVSGAVDAKFDCGYFLTLHINGVDYRGVLYAPPPYLPRSATPSASPAATPYGPPPTHPLGRATSLLHSHSDTLMAPSTTSTPCSQTNKRHRGKDDGKPKQNKTPFNYFSIDARTEAKRKHPNADQKEISRIVGEMWKAATVDDKQPYVEQSRVDRLRYEAELAEYLQAKKECSAGGSAAASSHGIGTPTDDDATDDIMMLAVSSQEAQHESNAAALAAAAASGSAFAAVTSGLQQQAPPSQQQHATAAAAAAVAAAQHQQRHQQHQQAAAAAAAAAPQLPQASQAQQQRAHYLSGMAGASPQVYTSLAMEQASCPPDISMHDSYPPTRQSASQFGQHPMQAPGTAYSPLMPLPSDLQQQDLYTGCSSPGSSELPDAMPFR